MNQSSFRLAVKSLQKLFAFTIIFVLGLLSIIATNGDNGEAGILQFNSATYAVTEGTDLIVTITVTRTDGSNGVVAVDYDTSNDTALESSDYIATSGTLIWDDGDVSSKTFIIPIIDNNDLESTESFNVTLSNNQIAILGDPKVATVNIIDDDDVTPPAVDSTNPQRSAIGALLTGPITATFNEALDPLTVNVGSFIVSDASGPVSGNLNLSLDGRIISFTPTSPFSYATRYDIQLTTAIKDIAGNQLAASYNWFFNTGKRLTAGRAHTCARLDDGGIKCWGGGFDGQLGLGDGLTRGDEPNEMGSNLPRVNLGTDRKVLQVVSGNWHNCARLDDNSVKCWGTAAMLGLGGGTEHGKVPNSMGDNLPAVDLGTNRTALELTAGGWHTCARLDDNSVKCWGDNATGQLGLGDINNRGDQPGEMGDSLPVVNLGTNRTALELSASLFHTCARLDNGSVKCWGAGNFGQLGLGDNTIRGNEPGEMGDALPAVNLGTGRTALDIETNSEHTCARLDNNTVKCWGYNNTGQLGLGDNNNRGDGPGEMGDALPVVDLGIGRTAQSLATGFSHSCARLDNNSLKCWGYNAFGQLGLGIIQQVGHNPGDMGDNLPAVDLGTGRTAREIVSKFNDTCARLDDASVKCWGSNYSGQSGLGDTVSRGNEVGEMGNNLPVVNVGN